MDNQIFPSSAKPFIDKLRQNTIRSGIRNVEEYIKQRKWKVRAGGNRFNSSSSLLVKSENPDFKATLLHPKENIFEWLKTLGEYQIQRNADCFLGELKFQKNVYALSIAYNLHDDSIDVEIKNTFGNIIFVSLLKRILNKATHCVHCEVCEVECPHGALSVVPIVRIDEKKCVRCHHCLSFIDNGCEVANSIRRTIGLTQNTNKMNQVRTTITQYNTFGLRERWLEYFFEHHTNYFKEATHGLNEKKQIPRFKRWLMDSEVLNDGKETLTEEGLILVQAFMANRTIVWEIIWTNLCNNTDLCTWFIANFHFSRSFSREELNASFYDSFPQYTKDGKDNSMKAFLNTFKESPLGSIIPVCVPNISGKNVVGISRRPHESLSPVAAAYSLYRYAERQRRTTLTVSEFYDERQTEGVYRQFGITRETFERLLLGLQEESNHVLRVELNMGLDNIVLREDLKPIDILKLML